MAPFPQKHVLAHERPEYKLGRPSEYKPEYCQLVIDKMEGGLSLSAFAGCIKVSRTAVYEWMRDYPEFSAAVARARSTRTLYLERKLLNSRKGAETTASIFALRNADPSEWRDMRTVQHDHNINVQTMSDEQLLAIASGHSEAPMIEHDPKPETDSNT